MGFVNKQPPTLYPAGSELILLGTNFLFFSLSSPLAISLDFRVLFSLGYIHRWVACHCQFCFAVKTVKSLLQRTARQNVLSEKNKKKKKSSDPNSHLLAPWDLVFYLTNSWILHLSRKIKEAKRKKREKKKIPPFTWIFHLAFLLFFFNL